MTGTYKPWRPPLRKARNSPSITQNAHVMHAFCVVKSCPYYTHYGAWSDNEKDFLRRHWGSEPNSSDCICIAHQREAKCKHSSGFVPKWSTNTTITSPKDHELCIYPSCTTSSKLVTPSFAPLSKLQAALQLPSEQVSLLICQNTINYCTGSLAVNLVLAVRLSLNQEHVSHGIVLILA